MEAQAEQQPHFPHLLAAVLVEFLPLALQLVELVGLFLAEQAGLAEQAEGMFCTPTGQEAEVLVAIAVLAEQVVLVE